MKRKIAGLQRVTMVLSCTVLAAFTFWVSGCGDSGSSASLGDDPSTAPELIQATWVEIGPNNQTIARAVTSDAFNCPFLKADGALTRMNIRVAAGTVPQRTTASAAADSKPSVFPYITCELTLAATTQSASIAGIVLPLPKVNPQRVLVLADTGCRMKKTDNIYQACSDPVAWPFPVVAATAVAMKPDLVLHIGDAHYRENACPSDIAGCQNSPWGYGWDAWQADFFKPGAALLAAAPWIMVRGNHEQCQRAGQGWYRFLDTRAYAAATSCDDPANDNTGNYSAPYGVMVGTDTQFIVFDSANAGAAALPTTDPQFIAYQPQFQAVAQIANKAGVASIFVNHHPILAYTPVAGANPTTGLASLQSVANAVYPQAYYPPGVQMAMHGHVHDLQIINFASNHPATIVSGNGGDTIGLNIPDPLPATVVPAAGTVVNNVAQTNTFGFMVMDRQAGGWQVRAFTAAGKLLTTCSFANSKIACDKQGFINP